MFTYRADWEKLSERIGYWLDYEHPYVTYSNDYVESVWWALTTLFDEGCCIADTRSCRTARAAARRCRATRSRRATRTSKDPSVYVALDLGRRTKRREDTASRILVWTTTPWTLVSNVALAVHPELEYVELRKRESETRRDDHPRRVARRARCSATTSPIAGRRCDRFTGAELVGGRYQRPLDWVEYPTDGKHEIIVGEDFVSADDGTGVVHMAPAFGADDYAAGQRHDLAFLQPVNLARRVPGRRCRSWAACS